MDLFKESESIEDFENKLNDPANEVNNIDINDDGYVDYIRVVDYTEGDAHSLTLQVPFSENESQDIAVIEIEKTDEATTVVQIVGDEDLYGENYIVEPSSSNSGSAGENVVVNVHLWKPIKFIYTPRYVIWRSPWKYRHYPKWYRPWKPVLRSVYFGRVRHHHVHYRRTKHFRCHRAHKHYRKHRAHSSTFHLHHKSHYNKHHRPNKPKGVRPGGKKNNVRKGKKGPHSPKSRRRKG
jgi:hypothetical protein